MRAPVLLTTLALLAVTVAPGASAARDPAGVVVDPDVQLGPDGCEGCVLVGLTVAQTYPDNCADCGGVGVYVGLDHDGDGTTVDAQVCRGGFVVICVIDRSVEI